MIHDNFPLVSVIVVTYNSAEYILDTLVSAKKQIYPNIELIISDDGSTDDTCDVCRKWLSENAEGFVSTKLLTVEANTGVSANCNRGVRASRGEWIKIIAGDDIMLDNCIDLNIKSIKANPHINVTFSKMRVYKEDFNDDSYQYTIPFQDPSYFFGENISTQNQYKMLLIGDRISLTTSAFCRKSLIEDVGYYDEDFPLVEDYPMWLKLTKNGHKLYYLPFETVGKRRHSNNLSDFKTPPLILPGFFRKEGISKKYVYANLPADLTLYQKSLFFYAKLLTSIGITKRSYLNKGVFLLLTRYINPFFLFIAVRRLIFRKKLDPFLYFNSEFHSKRQP